MDVIILRIFHLRILKLIKGTDSNFHFPPENKKCKVLIDVIWRKTHNHHHHQTEYKSVPKLQLLIGLGLVALSRVISGTKAESYDLSKSYLSMYYTAT